MTGHYVTEGGVAVNRTVFRNISPAFGFRAFAQLHIPKFWHKNEDMRFRVLVAVISLLFALSLSAFSQQHRQTLPRRLVICLDGVAWRDLIALQQGIVGDAEGHHRRIRAFDQGYYPVSRLVSTFPSCSDVAWTEILGNNPLPGYQRSFFDIAANTMVSESGINSTVEYESQMHLQVKDGWRRALGYLFTFHEFKHELRLLSENFMRRSAGIDTYYALLRTADDAQHMSGDVFAMLQFLDKHLQRLQREYRSATGRELEILILSDHGNNHAGPGKRLPIASFLKKAGYRVTTSIRSSRDVVLPTVGIQTWVEIHNGPNETEKLVSCLVDLPGVDIITSRAAGPGSEFIVCNRQGGRASISYDPAANRYRYRMISGDPLQYAPVLDSLHQKHLLDDDGFASAASWRTATLSQHYPVALERIACALTSITRNPASILLSLDNRYVHANWLVNVGSRLRTCGGTHGGLDDLNSDGILLSNFVPTYDSSAAEVGSEFSGFAGRNHASGPSTLQAGLK